MSYTVQENKLTAKGWEDKLGEAGIDQSMGADFFTAALDVLYFDMGALQIVWTGADATNATITIQGSVDNVNWCDLPGGTRIINEAADNQLFNVTSYGFKFVRLKFIANANTAGTFNARSVLKVMGY